MTWTASQGAATCNRARQKYGSSAWTSVATGLTVLTYEDVPPEIGVGYRYRVRPYNGNYSGPSKDSGYAKAQ